MSSKRPISLPDGFEHTTLRIPISEIMPLREVPSSVRKSVKYKQIAASIAEVGIIEPPVVFRDRDDPARYHLLEGHLRLAILLEQGETEVVCLVALEDEAFTYNRRVSRIAASAPVPDDSTQPESGLNEQHFTILYGDTGHSYETIIGPYLRGAKEVTIEDPYIRMHHQIQNFVRFCETCLKSGSIRTINLVSSYDSTAQLAEFSEKMEDLKQSLVEVDVVLNIAINPNLHDREIRIDNGWHVKIGRGLDFYQKPGSWFEVGANDLTLRKCLETKIDIFRVD
jgi:hypothetical protein